MTSGRDLFAPKLGLTLPLCGFHFIFFFLFVTDPKKVAGLFGFWPQPVSYTHLTLPTSDLV